MKKFLGFTLLAFIAAFAAYLAFLYYVPYSEGYRYGELIKFSKKGVIIKTWEGEISQGISGAQIFQFSVYRKDKDIINKLNEYNGDYVKLKYEEHYGKFFWWGKTRYFIKGVELDNTPFGQRLQNQSTVPAQNSTPVESQPQESQ